MKFKKLKDFEPFIENEETHKQLIKYLDEDNEVKQWEYCVGSCKGYIQRRKELLKNKKLDKEERKRQKILLKFDKASLKDCYKIYKQKAYFYWLLGF